jgi:hypothetical protein
MTTRVLVIDDEPDGLETICDRLQRAMAEHPRELSNAEVKPLDVSGMEPEQVLAAVRDLTAERWDGILIDVTLVDRESDDLESLLLPVKIAQTFRAANKTAIVCLYSGNIQDFLRNVYELEKKGSEKRPIEQTLRTIIEVRIAEFLARNDAPSMAVKLLLAAPLPLHLEREVLKTPNLEIETAALAGQLTRTMPNMITFGSVAESLRSGDQIGDLLLKLVVQHGVASVSKVFQLTQIRDVPLLCITSDCYDLEFLKNVIDAIKALMPKMETISLGASDAFPDTLSYLIQKAVDAPVIVMLLHGGDGYLKAADPSDSANAPEAPRWMDKREQLALFRDKVVYCFSCNSITLAKPAVEAGATAFIGFPDVPFYRFDGDTPRNEPELTASLQELFGTLTKRILLRWFLGKDTIEQLVSVIRITVRSLSLEFVRSNPEHPYRSDVVAMFDKIAQGVDYEGDGHWIFPGR